MKKSIRFILDNGKHVQVFLDKPIVTKRETTYKALVKDCGGNPYVLMIPEKHVTGSTETTLKQYLESKTK